MNRVKKITKLCISCQKQVPTATKSCPCGFKFGKQTFEELVIKEKRHTLDESQVVRTKRRCREKPHFFDALEYDSNFKKKSNILSSKSLNSGQKKKLRSTRQTLSESEDKPKILRSPSTTSCDTSCHSSQKQNTADSPVPFQKFTDEKGFLSGGLNEDSWDCDIFREQNQTFTYILSEINHKISSVASQPP